MPHTTSTNPAKGTLLKATIASVLTTIAQRVSLDGPELSVGEADATHLDSDAVESRPTLPDPGSISGTLFYDPQDPTHTFLFECWATPVLVDWALVFTDPEATTWPVSGFLTKLKPTNIEVQGLLQAEFEIRLSGLFTPTFTP